MKQSEESKAITEKAAKAIDRFKNYSDKHCAMIQCYLEGYQDGMAKTQSIYRDET